MAPLTVISVRDLVVGFGDRTVLDHVSLDVRKGEILGLVGGSGSGKSVFLRTIIGLLPKRSGRIDVFGQNIDDVGDRARHDLQRRTGRSFPEWRIVLIIDCVAERAVCDARILAPSGAGAR